MISNARSWLICALGLLAVCVGAQDFDDHFFSATKWRLIGPFRGGRITGVTGVPGQPATFLAATPGGGIWRTTDAGSVWRPISDALPFSSIGAIAVAPSDPKTIYGGTGEQIPGRGMFKSVDNGDTWAAIGLTNSRFITSIVVNPRDANTVIVGANDGGFSLIWPAKEKSPYHDGAGIFRTTDGGNTWTKVFMLDDSVGVVDLCADPNDSNKLYASFQRRAGGKKDAAVAATSFLYRSTDGGVIWSEFKGKGLPEKDLGRVGISVSRGRLYVIAAQGVFRSDDGGASWRQTSKDPRVIAAEYFGRIFADPNNPDVVYVAQTSMYRSTDGGQNFEAFAGAPSGDDYHLAWIDPADSNHIILGVDQGAVVSLNGGKTWSSWDNQATGQFYHVITDNAFPYRVYAAQQDSGTVAVASRSDLGQITPSDWYSVAGFEFCNIAPDPLNPNIVYSGGWYGSVLRFDKTTGQAATVFQRGKKYEAASMPPLLFSPHDPHTLLLAMQDVLKTLDGGLTWKEISPDLTATAGKVPAKDESSDGKPEKQSITALAVSPLESGLMWAGTSNHLVHVTRDGGASWENASPSGLAEHSAVRMIEPSHFAAGTAFMVLGAKHETLPPLIFRTRDFGMTWQPIAANLPLAEDANVVREDPVRPGLLYAGTVNAVYVSFDEGDHWKSLQLNLPHTSVTDLTIHGTDLIASTFGRALWILNDVSPLRQFNRAMQTAQASLLNPAEAVRTHWDTYQDTPLPAETPAGANPPDGAIINYYLGAAPQGEISLAIYDQNHRLIRSFSSTANAKQLPPANAPEYWFAPPDTLPHDAGLNRFVWDLRYDPPATLPYGYYGKLLDYTEYTLADHAIPGATPRQQPMAALVLPGTYDVELTVGQNKYRQKLTVALDPRVHLSTEDLAAQEQLLGRISSGMLASYNAFLQVETLRKAIKDEAQQKDLLKKLTEIQSGSDATPGFGPVNRELARIQAGVINADAKPGDTLIGAVEEYCGHLDAALAKWREVNAALPKQNAASLPVASVAASPACHGR